MSTNTETVEVPVGSSRWTLSVPTERRVPLTLGTLPRAVDSVSDAVRIALENPIGVGAPISRALTPDDRVCIAIDERAPQLIEVLIATVRYLVDARIDPARITLLVPAESREQPWMDLLPDELGDMQIEIHSPDNREKLAYLATTKRERRVYLNRTLVEADFGIVMSERGFDPRTGYSGGATFLFPRFADAQSQAEYPKAFHTMERPPEPNALRFEAKEILKLLGTTLLVQVIPGPAGTVSEIVAGLPASAAAGSMALKQRWLGRVPHAAELVIVTVGGPTGMMTFRELATALIVGKRALAGSGKLVLLSDAAPPLDDSGDLLLKVENPVTALKRLAKANLADSIPGTFWATAAKGISLYVAASWPDELIEELFATPVHKAGEVQRLIDASDSVLILPDAHKMHIEVGE